jgi:D-tyrosyl-tRNA(Tyr) deacylase
VTKKAYRSVIIQRVKSASVTVDEELISSIGKGLLVLAGVGKEDTEKEAENIVNKVLKAKFWPDENGSQVRMRMVLGYWYCHLGQC